MPHKTLVNWTNKIALSFVMILIYWVFIFSVMTVFDFKIFRQNLTETFVMSIFGILSVLFGVVIINVMLNLTRIADGQTGHSVLRGQFPVKWFLGFLLSFPLLFGALYYGDYLTKQKKQRHLIHTAQALIADNKPLIEKISRYEFSRQYFNQAKETLILLQKTDKTFPHVTLLFKDHVDNQPVIITPDNYYLGRHTADDKPLPPLKKIDYIYRTTANERRFILAMLNGEQDHVHYEAHKGNYALYYPLKTAHGNVVILLSQYQNYGKIGS